MQVSEKTLNIKIDKVFTWKKVVKLIINLWSNRSGDTLLLAVKNMAAQEALWKKAESRERLSFSFFALSNSAISSRTQQKLQTIFTGNLPNGKCSELLFLQTLKRQWG